jgi:hypothetical protein
MFIARGSRVKHLYVDGEDGVRPGGVRVHLGGPRGPVAPPLRHQGLALSSVAHRVKGNV